MIEYLANFLRSVIALSPTELATCLHLCLNQLAPAYEGIELGIAETTLMKVIAQTTGRTLAQVRQDARDTGDLGLVAEQSKSNQRMMIEPAALTVPGVFAKLRDIARKTGAASMNTKADKIQAIFVACRQSEARYFIRSLLGKLRIGLAEQSVLQVCDACILYILYFGYFGKLSYFILYLHYPIYLSIFEHIFTHFSFFYLNQIVIL